VALVITLFVVALVSVLVLEYYFDASVELDLAANYASDTQAYHLALAGVSFARTLLLRDPDREVDGLEDLWARLGALPTCVPPQQLLTLAGEGALGGSLVLERLTGFTEATASEVPCVSLRIVDEQSKLPINALVQAGSGQTPPPQGAQPQPPATGAPRPPRAGSPPNPRQGSSPTPSPGATGCVGMHADWEPIFKQLFEKLQIEEDKFAAVVDWLDQGDVPCGLGGAEDAYYEALKPRYKARNGPMHTPGEIRLVRGFDFDTLAKLFPEPSPEAALQDCRKRSPEEMADVDLGSNCYLTPYGTGLEAKVNLNTAPPEVLQILLAGIHEGVGSVDNLVKEIVEKRPFEDSAFNELTIIEAEVRNKLQKVAGVQSTYFRVTSTGTIGAIQKRVVVVLKRDQQETLSLVYLKVE
jgi:type II secretory pathway component PulK